MLQDDRTPGTRRTCPFRDGDDEQFLQHFAVGCFGEDQQAKVMTSSGVGVGVSIEAIVRLI